MKTFVLVAASRTLILYYIFQISVFFSKHPNGKEILAFDMQPPYIRASTVVMHAIWRPIYLCEYQTFKNSSSISNHESVESYVHISNIQKPNPTSQNKTHCYSGTKTNRLMLLREMNAEIWPLLGFYVKQSGNSVPTLPHYRSPRCVKFQKSANLIYMAAEAFSHDIIFVYSKTNKKHTNTLCHKMHNHSGFK